MPKRLERRQWVKYDHLYLALADLLDIGNALRREFPGLMFWPDDADDFEDYTQHVTRAFERSSIESKRDLSRCSPKPPPEMKSRLTGDPSSLLQSWRTHVWIVPPGWEPEWYVDEVGNPIVGNPPDLACTITRPLFWSSRLRLTNPTSPRMIQDAEHVELGHGAFFGNFWPWEEEKGRFLKRCKTIIRRHTTTRYVQVDDHGRIRFMSETETARDGRVGFHAIEWSRIDPRHFIGECLKPIDWQEPPTPKRIQFRR